MRIGIDSRPLRELRTSGIPAYVRNILLHLAEIDEKNEFILYAHKKFDFAVPNPRWHKRFGALTRFGTVWMQTELPFWLKQDKVDVFWGTQHTLPLAMPKSIKGILTIHDLVHLVFPGTMKTMNYIINKLIIPSSITRANALVADSQWTMNDVIKYFHPQNKKLTVIPMGVGPQFAKRNHEVAQEKVKRSFQLAFPYLLAVGTFEPRKNVIGTFRAFEQVAQKIPHHLVIVGQKGWKSQHVLGEIEKSPVRDRVHILGFVPDSLLPDIYAASDIFLFPSLYEGFGIPPLEAMACGVPVVTSNVSSLPEVVEEAAVLVNPNHYDEIAAGIMKLLADTNFRTEMIRRGHEQAKKFSWQKTAESMARVFSQVEELLV